MRSKFFRIIVIIITSLFGFISPCFYFVGEVVAIMNRKDMEGYFNVLGMIVVVLSLTLIFTYIQSLIFQIKILYYTRKNFASDLIDDDLTSVKQHWLIKTPSKFLRSSNLIFALTFTVYGLFNLFITLIVQKDDGVMLFITVVSIIIVAVGLILMFDAVRVKKLAAAMTTMSDPSID